MKTWGSDKLIGVGLCIALLVKIITDFVVALITGNVPSAELATNIASGLCGFLGKGFIDRHNRRDNDIDDRNR